MPAGDARTSLSIFRLNLIANSVTRWPPNDDPMTLAFDMSRLSRNPLTYVNLCGVDGSGKQFGTIVPHLIYLCSGQAITIHHESADAIVLFLVLMNHVLFYLFSSPLF